MSYRHKDLDDSEPSASKLRQTEVVLFGPERFREKLSSYIVTLDGISLASGPTGRNLGVISDQDPSSDSHIKLDSSLFERLRTELDRREVSVRSVPYL